MNRREWDVETFLRAHNEHLSPPGAHLQAAFRHRGPGLVRCLPRLLLLLHVVCVVLVYVLARERVEPQLALGVAAVVLFLGAAWNDLLVPFQISFLLSVAAGLGMLIALERRDVLGTITVAVLLAVSLASSSVGITFGAAAGVHVLVRDDRLRRLWAFASRGCSTSSGSWLTAIRRRHLGRPHAHDARKGQPPSAGVCRDSGSRSLGRYHRTRGGLGPAPWPLPHSSCSQCSSCERADDAAAPCCWPRQPRIGAWPCSART